MKNTEKKIHGNLGTHRSEETRKRMSEVHKREHLSEETRKKMSESNKGNKSTLGQHPSEETRKKISEAMKGGVGTKNNSWKGGITPVTQLIRNSPKYNQWRQDCFIRDNFICQKCGIMGTKLEVHHKKSFSKLLTEARHYMPLLSVYDAAMFYTPLWSIDNGITLCKKCHSHLRCMNGH